MVPYSTCTCLPSFTFADRSASATEQRTNRASVLIGNELIAGQVTAGWSNNLSALTGTYSLELTGGEVPVNSNARSRTDCLIPPNFVPTENGLRPF